MESSNLMVTAAQCSAMSKGSGQRCRRKAILGGTVCPMHGGAARQVKEAAQRRLDALVDPAIVGLRASLDANQVVVVSGGKEAATTITVADHSTRLRAQTAILDRTGYGPTKRTEISGPDGEPVKLVVDAEAV